MARPARQKHRTRRELLPLPEANVRALSLEHHAALAALCRDGAHAMQVWVLLRTICLSYLMDGGTRARLDPAPFRAAATILEACITRGKSEGVWRLDAGATLPIATLLIRHDAQLTHCRAHVYAHAWEQMMAAARIKTSPLADGYLFPIDGVPLLRLNLLALSN
ncbi:hypothetical protein [Burkholderia sp. BCC0405]|uniref:hypothetical protein n=1 Tax=Burkholderia sp. BCC0405 TaxID=2676298 RepID=UPI001588FC1A|nr:hypothetical protein [Burkholderia sp. BCC0405]